MSVSLDLHSFCLYVYISHSPATPTPSSHIQGSAYTSIEPEHGINQVHHLPGSGLVLMAVEDPKMLAYYVPVSPPYGILLTGLISVLN